MWMSTCRRRCKYKCKFKCKYKWMSTCRRRRFADRPAPLRSIAPTSLKPTPKLEDPMRRSPLGASYCILYTIRRSSLGASYFILYTMRRSSLGAVATHTLSLRAPSAAPSPAAAFPGRTQCGVPRPRSLLRQLMRAACSVGKAQAGRMSGLVSCAREPLGAELLAIGFGSVQPVATRVAACLESEGIVAPLSL